MPCRASPRTCGSTEEIDYYWTRLPDGAQEGPGGWAKDRYGLWWQVVPAGFEELMCDPDPGRRDRAMRAVLGMKKVDVPPHVIDYAT